jgi:hypothetical protein
MSKEIMYERLTQFLAEVIIPIDKHYSIGLSCREKAMPQTESVFKPEIIIYYNSRNITKFIVDLGGDGLNPKPIKPTISNLMMAVELVNVVKEKLKDMKEEIRYE